MNIAITFAKASTFIAGTSVFVSLGLTLTFALVTQRSDFFNHLRPIPQNGQTHSSNSSANTR